MFKENFKYYKQKCPPPSFNDVLDFRSDVSLEGKIIQKNPLEYGSVYKRNCQEFFKPQKEWKIYEIKDRPGLLFIQNPWTAFGQRYWIARCLMDYTKKPSKLNLDADERSPWDEKGWWFAAMHDEYECEGKGKLMKKLRWATLGYHHNWNSKTYKEDNKSEFPQDLWLICRYVAESVGGWNEFNAQAAIINFYHPDCTLSGHRDESEHNMMAPLLSFSFGLSAIFLIGGCELKDDPTAMFIDSGDIVIMSSNARHAYHAIPRIVTSDIRKVSEDCYNDISQCHHVSLVSVNNFGFNECMLSCLTDDNYWSKLKKYIERSRINMNVRQVLFNYETKLP
ncbi:alpha-ketoglutarate-dependent dioxygenase AlkB [Lycorma delicatula]|uniref:alpha-ketoglutarate-dependent dioxygenase AlkB n=1 Tax=Lycorma delicatula TaxID=130591 RepID=UPI003F511A1E